MSAASLATYLIGKLKIDETTTREMSGSNKGSPTPRLTAVWRAKSIPYDIPNNSSSSSFRNDSSLLRLLRTKSMPLLGIESTTPPRQLVVPIHSRTPPRSESPSPVRHHPTIRNGHLSDASESTVPSVTTPPPTPRSPSPTGHRHRSASDGHLWQRRKKQVRQATDKAAVMLPSVKDLRGKFDEKPASPPGDEHSSAERHDQVDDDTLQEESTMDKGQGRRRVSRHYSLVRHEIKTPERLPSPKPAVTPANVKKLLEKFEVPPQDTDETNEEFPGMEQEVLRNKSRSEANLRKASPEARQVDPMRLRTSFASRPRTKKHRRSKSEPDASAVMRHHALTSPPSVKKLKMVFERESLAGASHGFSRSVAQDRTIPEEWQKETTLEPLLVQESPGKPNEETTVVHTSIADSMHLGVMDDANWLKQQAKIPPMFEVDYVLTAKTSSVRSLRQRFEVGTSVQSLVKTDQEEAAPRSRCSNISQLKTPFEKSELQKSKSVSPGKETPQTFTNSSCASVKNLLRQFETLPASETLLSAQEGQEHCLSPTHSSSLKEASKLTRLSYDLSTGEVMKYPDSSYNVTHEVDVNSKKPLRRRSRMSSSSSSSDDEWRAEEERRRKKMQLEWKKKEEEEERKKKLESEQRQILSENLEIERITDVKEKERITQDMEEELKEQKREATRKEEERKAREIQDIEREIKRSEELIAIQERKEQERLAKKKEESRKERELLEHNEKEEAKRKREKERKDEETKIEKIKEQERTSQEKEIQQRIEQREQVKAGREKTHEEKQNNPERIDDNKVHNEQLEEEWKKADEKDNRKELSVTLSDEEMRKDTGPVEAPEDDKNRRDDKPSDRKVYEIIDRFTHLRHHGDALPAETNNSQQKEASSEQKVERLIDQFTNPRDVDFEEERQRAVVDMLDIDRTEGRRCSDVAALVNKFRKLNERKTSSSSSSSGSEDESCRTREKPVMEEAPIPTIPARSNVPGKVRTLREDEIRFFESSADGGGAGAEPFMRTQSLRIKKTETSSFTQPRFGSLRGGKSRVAVLSTSTTTTAALPKNCRRLNTDELRFFTGEVTNIYRSRTNKTRGGAGMTGRPPKAPQDKPLPDTEEFFRIAGQDAPEGNRNGCPVSSDDDSDSEVDVLRGNGDVVTDSDGDIYEVDINLRSDADTEDLSDTEHLSDLNHPLSMLVHSIKGELLQPLDTESRCYVVFSPSNYLCSSEDEEEALQLSYPSNAFTENVSAPILQENVTFPSMSVKGEALQDTLWQAETLGVSIKHSEIGQGDQQHIHDEKHSMQPRKIPFDEEEETQSSHITDSSQHQTPTKENCTFIDFVGETKTDSPLLELREPVLMDSRTEERSRVGNNEDNRPLLTQEGVPSVEDEEKGKRYTTDSKEASLLKDLKESPSLLVSFLQERKQTISLFMNEIESQDPLSPTTTSPPTNNRQLKDEHMNADEDSFIEDAHGLIRERGQDIRGIEEQIIPLASSPELLTCSKGPLSTPSSDSSCSGVIKSRREAGTPLESTITPLGTTEDLFIADIPLKSPESVLDSNCSNTKGDEEDEKKKNEAEEEEEEVKAIEKEYHIPSFTSHHPKKQEEDHMKISDVTVTREQEEEDVEVTQTRTPPPPSPSQTWTAEDFITGREFIKFCVCSLWLSFILYFFSDLLQ